MDNDKKLKEIESKIIKSYEKTSIGISDDLYSFFLKFKDEDEEKRKLVEEKKMKGSEYRAWRISLMGKKEYKEIIKKASMIITEINVKSINYVNSQIPYFYCSSYNSSGNEIKEEVNANFIV